MRRDHEEVEQAGRLKLGIQLHLGRAERSKGVLLKRIAARVQRQHNAAQQQGARSTPAGQAVLWLRDRQRTRFEFKRM